ncbi:MAG: type II secretion system protein [Candidatus Aminicenantes bacterium]|nr:type II secretion system protein [Candidatus Aminicenantes bacterium]
MNKINVFQKYVRKENLPDGGCGSLHPGNGFDRNKDKAGFSLIEVLFSIAILSFVIVSILSAFAQRMQTDRNTGFKNVAIILAEAKLEEYIKFPSTQISMAFPATAVDYIVYKGGKRPEILQSDPGLNKQFRRTAQVTQDGNLARIRVVVEYGYVARDSHYPFRVVLSSQRGL